MIIGRVLGLARGIALAWLVTREEFGLFHVALALVNVLMPLCSMGLPQGLLRYAAVHEAAGTLLVFVRRAMWLCLAIAAAGSVVLAVAADPLGRVFFAANEAAPIEQSGAPTASLLRIGAGCVFSLVLYHLVSHLMKGLRLFRAANLMEVSGALLFTGSAIGAALVGYRTAGALLMAYALSNLVSVALFAPSLFRSLRSYVRSAGQSVSDSAIGGQLLRYSVWMAGAAVVWHGLQNYALWHLAKAGGNELGGSFQAARLFAQLLLWGALGAATVLTSHAARVWESGNRDQSVTELQAASKLGLLVILGGAVLMSLAKDWLIRMFRSDYALGATCFDPLLLGYAWFAATLLLSVRFHLAERSVYSFFASLAGMAVSIGAAFLLLGGFDSWSGRTPAEMILRAGWVCAAGGGASVVACMLLLTVGGAKREVKDMKRGRSPALGSGGVVTGLLILSMVSVGFGGLYGMVVLGVAVVAAVSGLGVFTSTERSVLSKWRQFR